MSDPRMALIDIIPPKLVDIPVEPSPPADDQPPISVFTTMVGDVPVTVISGDIDMTTRAVAQAEITAQLQTHPVTLVLDLIEVSFFGSAGVRLLVESQHDATDSGCRLVVVAHSARVGRVLTLTEVDSLLELQPDIVTAMRSL
ncbi:hypothetical protein GCM10011609_85480 [Lentzea pudingi]|uniref:Anti-sigma factor antagonist n=1 Tax=Lentzea pudingi TaxID=1789439 RepID=A0ABQ2IW00_9PSEU|nr:STAS domain-containing protein [Lentzea pudingi]GGN28889.1 hypothetical protein GCM10011609_85480 [Lentzea pudingi]